MDHRHHLTCSVKFVQALVLGIGAVVWSDNTRNSAPVWCDIVSHIIVGAESGMSACTLVITHHLYDITRFHDVVAHRTCLIRSKLWFDVVLGIIFRLIVISLYYTIQSSRFEIYEEYGCYFSVHVSWVSILLLNSFAVAFPIIAIIFYCPTIARVLYKHLTELDDFLDGNRALARRQYLRILAMGLTDIIFTLPIGIFFMIDAIKSAPGHMVFYPGWNVVHSDWSPRFHPSHEWQGQSWTAWRLRFDQYMAIFFGIGFFIGFGLTEEALLGYRRALDAVGLGWVGSKKGSERSSEDLSALEFATRFGNDQ